MSIEAEIKARLADPAAVRERLGGIASAVAETYRDIYLDSPDGDLAAASAELRVRGVERDDGTARHVLTFKGSPVDEATQSKPEYETAVLDPAQTVQILAGLGYLPVLTFTKDCLHYRFVREGREFVATVVTVPEIDGTYLEVETRASDNEVAAALTAVRDILLDLGVTDAELTTDTYTEAVRAARSVPGADTNQ
jgi:adenylate cyclase class 2